MNEYEDIKLPDWNRYFPRELEYYTNASRRDLFCRFKLSQIYQDYCLARANCIFADSRTNYGDLDYKGMNKVWLRKMFLQNALVYFNICIDLSWVMVYFFCVIDDNSNLKISQHEIDKIEKNVREKTLYKELDKKINNANGTDKTMYQNLKDLIEDFMENRIPEDFREDYNELKHRKAFNIIGVPQDQVSFFNNSNILVLKNKEFDIDKYSSKMKEFAKEFCNYIDEIIELIIKPNQDEKSQDNNLE